MSTLRHREPAFLSRFQSLWSRKRRTELLQVLVGAVLLSVVGFGLIAAADYVWELSRTARLTLLGSTAIGLLTYLLVSFWQAWTNSGRPATAVEIERAFPQLGQSIRTSVEYGGRSPDQVHSDGVATTLVEAMVEQTHQRALPLTLEDVIPTKRVSRLAISSAAIAAFIAGASLIDWEWGNATRRAVLAENAYRSLEVRPGNETVDEGTLAKIEIALVGRTNRDVVLLTRPAEDPDAEWMERSLDKQSSEKQSAVAITNDSSHDNSQPSDGTRANSSNSGTRPRAEYVASLDRVNRPIEYRVVAGELSSPTYRIDVRRPLKLERIEIDLTPPAYTGQETAVSLDGNLSVLEGTLANFKLTFDKPVKSALLTLTPRRKPSDDETKVEPLVVRLQQPEDASSEKTTSTLSASVTLLEDSHYRIEAEASDGTSLPETQFRVRVREDQPPQVSFDSPDDAIEVHSLAELPMRLRVRDDYGLTQAGVVFQVNNEQSIPLIAQEFEVVAAAANEVAATGKVSPTTQAALEKVLPLEFFELTQKDSVMYFGFAEDNRPDRSQRTETDMRFIDIRPFKRSYQSVDPDPQPGMGGGGLKSLEELIKRQRFGLNQTMQIERRAATGRTPDARALDQLMSFEKELAENVRQTAEGLLARGFDDVELLFQAETSMLAAVDSLSVGKWETATLQMKDALKALIEQRDRTLIFLLKNPTPEELAALRAFDRMQAQKLRRPKSDKEEARELIRRLQTLIAEEEAVAESLEEGEKSDSDQAKERLNDAKEPT